MHDPRPAQDPTVPDRGGPTRPRPGPGRRSVPALLAALTALAPTLPGHGPGAPLQEVPDPLRVLTEGGPEAAEAFRDLRRQGEAAAARALEVLAGRPADPGARRRLAALVQEAGGPSNLAAACALVDDPDEAVRRDLLEFLLRPEHGLAAEAERVAALARVAARDPLSTVRRRALVALGELDSDLATATLLELARSLPAPDRARAAAALRPVPRSREAVRELVRAGFETPPGSARTPDDVLAVVLPLHGRLLADEEGGGESPRDRAPLVLGLRHPAEEVREAAGKAFERLLGRLRDIGETDRARRLLGLLADQGLDPRALAYQEARLALAAAADPEGALRAALAMRSAGGRGESLESEFEGALWSFRSFYLEGLARFAAGEGEAALAPLERAGETLELVLRRRLDLEQDDASRMDHVDAVHQRALALIASMLVRLSLEPGRDAERVDDALHAHRLSLEAHRGYVRVVGDALATWDNLLEHDLSPLRLCFNLREFPGLGVSEGLELQRRLGRVLASVAPREMPGLEPLPGQPAEVLDPLADPRRRALLRDVFEEGLAHVEEELDDLRQRFVRRQIEQPGQLADPREELELQRLLRARMRLNETLLRLDEDPSELLEQRIPSSLALWIAQDLRAEGRAAEARGLTERMRADLEGDPAASRYFWGLQMQARIEMAIGSSWTDEDQPRRAEEELLKAVERLEGIEERLRELGASRRQVAAIEGIRANALVSLAVNANVKLRDPELALEYYERAYELRQDDFMRVLLACYRARMGRDEEARALLRELQPHPDLYYNMACTYALLGDTERALDYLEKEFEENLASEAARERQRAWARQDPDLESLVGDPRFERLVGEG